MELRAVPAASVEVNRTKFSLERVGVSAVFFAAGQGHQMPLYYFNINHNGRVVPDEEGSDLPDLKAAVIEAQECAREMLADHVRARASTTGKRIEITDEHGTVLGSVPLLDMLN